MTLMNVRRFILSLLAALLLPALAGAQGGASPTPSPAETMDIFPYQYVDYTQAGHEYRLVNAQAVVLGEILSMREIEGTEKSLTRSVTLRIESFLLRDRPASQQDARKIKFRCMPLEPPLDDMQVGDRCMVLLSRDLNFDNMLILPTSYHYYPVSKDGIVTKLFKEGPTIDPPLRREVALSNFLREIRRVLDRVSIEKQAHNADLVFQGTVEDAAQGKGPERDYFIAKVAPDNIYKGDPGKGIIQIHTFNSIEKYTLRTLNRPSFRVGQKILVFANKDPTLSAQGPSNPDGETRWVPLSGKQSIWNVYPKTVWRSGKWPIKSAEFFQTLEKSIAR